MPKFENAREIFDALQGGATPEELMKELLAEPLPEFNPEV